MAPGLRSTDGKPAAMPLSQGPYTTDQQHFSDQAELDNINRYVLEEYFSQAPGINADLASTTESVNTPVNKHFEIKGTGGTSALATFSTTLGALTLTTDTSSADQMIVAPHLDTKQTAWTGILWGTENQVNWEAVVRTGASIADITLWAGLKLTDTETIITDADQVYFRFDSTDDTNWNVISSIGGTDIATDSNVVVAADTTYHFKVKIASDRTATIFIDNNKIFTTAALTDDVSFIPYIGVQTDTTAGKVINVVKEKISRIIFE